MCHHILCSSHGVFHLYTCCMISVSFGPLAAVALWPLSPVPPWDKNQVKICWDPISKNVLKPQQHESPRASKAAKLFKWSNETCSPWPPLAALGLPGKGTRYATSQFSPLVQSSMGCRIKGCSCTPCTAVENAPARLLRFASYELDVIYTRPLHLVT